jgi:osmotically-inducible protein OsmY
MLDLANNIEVQPPARLTRTDAAIADAVRMALEWHALIPSQHIRSTVLHGVVTLYGTVDSWRQIAEAESVVGNIAGVRDVVSEVVVSAPEIATDTVQHDIEAALERRADRVAWRIQVGVHDGLVTLSGTVHSLAEHEAVLGAARFTHGVRSVEDHLRVDQTTGD